MQTKILKLTAATSGTSPRIIKVIEYILSGTLIFSIPLLLRGPQLLVGSVVNGILVLSALRTDGTLKNLSIIALPGLAAVLGGMLFGSFTPQLLYLLPFIWAGNFLLLYGIKYLYLHKKAAYLPALLAATGLKVLIIFTGTLLCFRLALVPVVFLKSMSLLQGVTAVIGGSLAGLLNLAIAKKNRTF